MREIRSFLQKLCGLIAAKHPEEDYFGHDPEALKELLRRIHRNGDLGELQTPRPLVTLEEFFRGNDDYASIGFNLEDTLPPQVFYDFFRAIREKPEVQDVRVMIIGQEEPDSWPWSDTIWLITSANPDQVAGWLGRKFRADQLILGFEQDSRKPEPYSLPEGMNAIGVWWD